MPPTSLRMPQGRYMAVQTAGIDSPEEAMLVSMEKTYNWPYDFFSFVELINIDAEVLFKTPKEGESTYVFSGTGTGPGTMMIPGYATEKDSTIDFDRFRPVRTGPRGPMGGLTMTGAKRDKVSDRILKAAKRAAAQSVQKVKVRGAKEPAVRLGFPSLKVTKKY